MRDTDPTASEFISSGYLEKSGRRYDPASITAATAAGPIIGGLMGSNGASDASDAQVASGKEANALQKYIFDTQRGDQKQIYDQQRGDQLPFRQAGLTAQNRLMQLLGIGGSPGGQQRPQMSMQPMQPMPSAGMFGLPMPEVQPMQPMQPMQELPYRMTSDGVRGQLQAGGGDMAALRAQLLPQFTLKQGNNGAVGGGHIENGDWVNDAPGAPAGDMIDEAGLQAAISQQQGQQGQQGQQQGQTMPMHPGSQDSAGNQMPVPGPIDSSASDYGSLMKDFSPQDFTAGMDPGYEWRKQQGMDAMQRSASAAGGLYSGATMKGLNDYAQGAASQEYGAAFNRFQTNRSNKLNPLQSLMGAGQTAANQVGSAGQNYGNALGQGAMNYGNQASQNITGMGNARASGYMGQANALAGGMGQAYNNHQNNSMIDLYRQRENRLGGGGGGYESWQTSGNGMPGGYM